MTVFVSHREAELAQRSAVLGTLAGIEAALEQRPEDRRVDLRLGPVNTTSARRT